MKYLILFFLLFTVQLSVNSYSQSDVEKDAVSESEAASEASAESKPDQVPEIKKGQETETVADPNIDTRPKTRSESNIESKTAPVPKPETETNIETVTDTKTESIYDIRNSIVKIYTQMVSPYYSDPWTMDSAQFHTGSGVIISGNRILTNAHVVANHTLVQVRRYGEARRYTARVLHVSHETDLAVLTIENPEFFENTMPLEIGMLPETQEEVLVYGFPKGGDTLSITKGVISRIEHEVYAQSNIPFLAAQIDAPINPGNSGGPAINNKKVVGIIMQTLVKSENIGYMVPPPIIKHFLKDISDSEYKGFPSLGIRTQNIENEGLRKKYGLKNKNTGVLITKVIPGSPADGNLMLKDILVAIEGKKISGNGTVEFRPKERTHYSYFIQNKQINDPLEVEVIRNGGKKKINVVLDTPIQDIQLVKIQNDVLPSYFIYGGLVFSTLTLNYLKEWGKQWYRKAPSELVTLAKYNSKSREGQEVVLLIRVLASDVNLGYHENENLIITKVNGTEINNLIDLVGIVETSEGEYVTFEDANGNEIVIDKNKALRTNPRILKIYRIGSDRSDDLRKSEELQKVEDSGT